MSAAPPVALTIAGSDSGGGAGVQADLKTFHAFGVFGASAVTAVTAQNTVGVYAVHAVPTEVVGAQIDAVVDDLAPGSIKTGMLATAELVETVADAIGRHRLSRYVMDPVMVATSGDRLLDPDAVTALMSRLMPMSALVTPNLHEASILTGGTLSNVDDMRTAARRLVDAGAGAALVKGGHLEADSAVDVFWDGTDERTWSRARVRGRELHGTGCTLSAAAAAGLAHGLPVVDAVHAAIDFVARAIASAPALGRGSAPVNHFVEGHLDPER